MGTHKEIGQLNDLITACKNKLKGCEEDLEHLKTNDVSSIWLTENKEIDLYHREYKRRNFDDATREMLKTLAKLMIESKKQFLERKIIELTKQLKEEIEKL